MATKKYPARQGDRLTKREIEALYLVAQGESNRSIAYSLFIRESTVGFHLGRVYRKLGVCCRVDACRMAIKLGLLPCIESSNSRGVRLTLREGEVLDSFATGHTTKETANALHISERTVDFHRSDIYNKLRVNSRIQAFRVATQLGLVTFDPSFGRLRE